jgi:hypothetical protein
MSASTASIFDAFPAQKKAVSFRLILGLYGIIPLCLALQLFDGWFWQDFLKQNLPSSPFHFVLFQILFGTPHIIASNIVLVSNQDYFKHYQRHIIGMSIAIAIAYFFGNMIFPYRALYIAVAALTVFHVLKQQYGIAKGLCRLPEWAYKLLLCLSVAAGLVIYIGIFLHGTLDPETVLWVKNCAAAGCIVLGLAGIYCQRYVTDIFGKWFYWSNILLVITSFYLFYQQYYFMAILVPRFVHDTTAYVFYVVHDYNKHARQPKNLLYRCAERCNLHVFMVLPVLSFALAFLLQAYGDEAVNVITRYLLGKEFYKLITMGLLGYLALMHYYMEGLTWQKDSPYRNYIAFTR